MSRVPVNLFMDDLAAGARRTQAADEAVSRGGLVDAVRPGSIADEVGIRPGVRVMGANGRVLRDVVDFQFYTAEPVVELLVREPEGDERTYRIEKWPDDEIGLEFAEATWDGVRVCDNTCPFCFLKGLPKGMRRTLYVKDDDYRLSFLHGNFVTLTNLTDADWERLAEQRLSPLHISVHATEPELRRRLLGHATAPDIVEQLRRLGSLRIQCDTQVVLCPGINDGAHLDRTIADLGALYPTVRSIAVVPVGATQQFEERVLIGGRGIEESRFADAGYSRGLVRQITGWQRRFMEEHGDAIVHASDEFYLTAGARIPAARWYDGFPQYENGIGMTRALLDEWYDVRRQLRRGALTLPGVRVVVACGAQIASALTPIWAEFDSLVGTTTTVVPVPNRHFGARINSSGLLVGADIRAAIEDIPADVAILPRTALDYFGRKFLDDTTPGDIRESLHLPILFASGMADAAEGLEAYASGAGETIPARNAATNGIFWARGERAVV